MELSCPLGTTRLVPQEKFPQKPYNINPLLTKLVRSRWLDIGLVLFLRQGWERLTSITNDKLVKFRLHFSRSANRDVVPVTCIDENLLYHRNDVTTLQAFHFWV